MTFSEKKLEFSGFPPAEFLGVEGEHPTWFYTVPHLMVPPAIGVLIDNTPVVFQRQESGAPPAALQAKAHLRYEANLNGDGKAVLFFIQR